MKQWYEYTYDGENLSVTVDQAHKFSGTTDYFIMAHAENYSYGRRRITQEQFAELQKKGELSGGGSHGDTIQNGQLNWL